VSPPSYTPQESVLQFKPLFSYDFMGDMVYDKLLWFFDKRFLIKLPHRFSAGFDMMCTGYDSQGAWKMIDEGIKYVLAPPMSSRIVIDMSALRTTRQT
jgi:hypothetical protein